MGFLTAYSKTTKIYLGEDDHYWVELKDCLSQGDKTEAENALTVGQFKPGQDDLSMTMDVARYRQLMVLASVKDWNLDDDEGRVWPINIESVQMLPGTEFDKIWKVVDKKNAPASTEEKRQFPVEGVGGSANGRSRAAKSR